ncbi:MAG: dTDP-4-dehydrorhamnose 3,5-epimerase [Bacteroidia bacterium]|jgi:dTDP-4-dehydrorhamnose 3,5-epimerase
MNVFKTDIEGLLEFRSVAYEDERGSLCEVFNDDTKRILPSFSTCLELEVRSKTGVIRGFHYQVEEYAQAKLVRVISGKIMDVVVDLRHSSITFGKCSWRILSDLNLQTLYVPRGFGHAYQTLSEAKVSYKLDNPYNKEHSRGIRFDDPSLDIPWDDRFPIIMSPTDISFPFFQEAQYFE